MLAQIIGRAEGHDLGLLAAATGRRARLAMARWRASFQSARSCAETSCASGSATSTRKAGSTPARRASSMAVMAAAGSSIGSARNGPLSGVARSSAGSASARQRPDQRLCAADQHRRFGRGIALVGQLQRGGARGGNQHARALTPGAKPVSAGNSTARRCAAPSHGAAHPAPAPLGG
jgi:hypothetical protein